MTEQEKIQLLEEVMELDEGELQADSVLGDIEEWDSLSKLTLMAEIKKKFAKTVSVEDIRSFRMVKDVCDFLQ